MYAPIGSQFTMTDQRKVTYSAGVKPWNKKHITTYVAILLESHYFSSTAVQSVMADILALFLLFGIPHLSLEMSLDSHCKLL